MTLDTPIPPTVWRPGRDPPVRPRQYRFYTLRYGSAGCRGLPPDGRQQHHVRHIPALVLQRDDVADVPARSRPVFPGDGPARPHPAGHRAARHRLLDPAGSDRAGGELLGDLPAPAGDGRPGAPARRSPRRPVGGAERRGARRLVVVQRIGPAVRRRAGDVDGRDWIVAQASSPWQPPGHWPCSWPSAWGFECCPGASGGG